MIGSELDSGDIVERDYLSINENTKITQIISAEPKFSTFY